MTPLEAELQHMLSLMDSPHSFLGWRDYVAWKAEALARKRPHEYSQLPQMLSAELRRLESKHSPPKQQGRGTH